MRTATRTWCPSGSPGTATRFLVGADAGDHKVENLRRAGRASLEIDSDLRRKRGILVRGAADLVEGAEAARALPQR